MKKFRVILLFLNVLQLCVSLEHIWHSYQSDPDHKSREELVVTNIVADEHYEFDGAVEKWKSLCLIDRCFLAGLMEKDVAIISLKPGGDNDTFVQNSYQLDLDVKPVDIAVSHYWNFSSLNLQVVVTIATETSELRWYKIDEENKTMYWTWPLGKNVSHINVFPMEYDHYLLTINKHLSHTTADLYVYDPNEQNFWFRQTIPLSDFASSSAVVSTDLHHFLAIPQRSLDTVQIFIYQHEDFITYKNISSTGVDDVVAFKVGQKPFLAFNGLNAGIYRLTGEELVRENITGSHTDGVNYWLPIPLTVYGHDIILVAQRILKHGFHKSVVIEVITYNGQNFEEHDDIPCLYFGETGLGLSCLPDEDAQRGINGTVSIFLDNIVGLLVPRDNRSEFFFVKTDLLKIPNPLEKQIEDLVARKQQIDELISIQEGRYNELQRSQKPVDYLEIEAQLNEIEEEIQKMIEWASSEENTPRYDTVIFNGVVKVKSSGEFDEVFAEKINSEPADVLLDDIVLKNNIRTIGGSKIFKNIEVEDLKVNQINNIVSTDLLYADDNVTITGDWFLTKPLMVTKNLDAVTVNGLIFEDEIIDSRSSVSSLVFENLIILGNASVEKLNSHHVPINTNSNKFIFEKMAHRELFIPQNVHVGKINGEDFEEFLTKLCLKNIKNYVPGSIRINGDVTVLEDGETQFLNDLEFPREYVFVDESDSNITGTKNFSSLAVFALFVEETVDDIAPSRVITLRTEQNISGITTFKNLKITESLNVEGKIIGEHASKFLPNPTLLETNFVKSKIHFKHLRVEGDIIVRENFNGKNLLSQLCDVVYETEDKPVIEAMKQFSEGFTVRSNLLISSNSVNNINLDSIITKNTEQNLNISLLKGPVTFDNVDIEGLYNSMDVKHLNEELVKLYGEQYISSTLIFEDEIFVNNLEVVESLKKVSSRLLKNKDQNNTVEVQNMVVEGHVHGDIDGFDLNNFDKNRMSFSKDEFVEVDLFINKSFVEDLHSAGLKFTYELWEDKLMTKLLNGGIEIENFFVNQSIEISKINNSTVMNMGGCFWDHDVKKHNITQLTFTDDVFFDTIQIEKLSGVDFKTYTENMVFKNETNVKLSGRKTFANGLSVEKLVEIEKLNNILLPNILTRHGEQEITSPLTIHGSVSFEKNVTVLENIGTVPIDTITEIYQDMDHNFQIKGDVLFNRLAHIHNLEIQGYVDDRRVQNVIEGIAYREDNFKLPGLITFDNEVNIDKNIVNGKINEIDLPAFVSNMVMITKDTTILSPVRFENAAFVENEIVLHKGLKTEDLNGIDLNSWVDKAIFINKGYLHGNYIFENIQVVDSLRTEYINDIDIKTLIPLRTQQNLSVLSFNEISLFKDVDVGNSTNLVNLPEEFDNSVLTNSDQDIDSDIEFVGNVFIEGDMELLGSLNGMETNRIVTTNTEQELSAIYNFRSKVNLEKSLYVKGLVNGIDVNKWAREGVRTSSPHSQNITGNWNLQHDLVFEEDCNGNGLINGIDFKNFSKEIEEKRNTKYLVEKEFIDDYKNLCKDLTYMYDKVKSQIYKFDYLEHLQTLNFQNRIEYTYNYDYQNNPYLIVNERKNCESHLFMFDSRFRYMKSIHFGHIAQIISVHYNDLMYIVVRNRPFYSTCKVQGTNLWQLTDNGFENHANIEEQDLLQESLQPGTFYGIKGYIVTEFKILPNLDTVRKYARWEIREDNMAFVPRGLATGLAVHTGKKLIRLHRDNSITDDLSFELEKIIIGNYSEESNAYFPGRKDSDLVVMKVGIKSNKINLLAVASHEETRVKGSLDIIKIYEDVLSGKIFHKIATYKPSSLVSLDLGNGETLLVFMEDENAVHVYEYRGIEGFKHKLSAKLEGSKLFAMNLKKSGQKALGVIDKNRITFIKVVMSGNQIEENLDCSL